MIKKAYMQGEVEFEDGENGEEGAASPRNVGHNIYILAHQVRRPRAGRGSERHGPPASPWLSPRPPGPGGSPPCRAGCQDTSAFPPWWGHVPGNPPAPPFLKAFALSSSTYVVDDSVWRFWLFINIDESV